MFQSFLWREKSVQIQNSNYVQVRHSYRTLLLGTSLLSCLDLSCYSQPASLRCSEGGFVVFFRFAKFGGSGTVAEEWESVSRRTWKTDRVGSRSDRWNGIWNSYLILFELKFDTNRCHHSPNLCSLFFAPPPPVPSFSHQLNTHILLAIYPLLHYTTHHEISSSTSPYHLKHSFCKVPVQLLYLKCLRAPCIACNNDI